jgi:carbonic anhydrase
VHHDERADLRLVVVRGHSQCGAVLATIDELRRPTETRSQSFGAIVDRVRPSVEGLLAADFKLDSEALVRHAVRANVRAPANHLRHGSQLLEQLIRDVGLLVVGAECSLDTGVVESFDGAPEADPPPSEDRVRRARTRD